MSGQYILDEEGNPQLEYDLAKWGRWMEESPARVLKKTKIDNVEVSTVFLGLYHSFGGGLPVLWETMIFGGYYDQWQDRYHTREQAVTGHEAACEKVRHFDKLATIDRPLFEAKFGEAGG